MWSEMGFIDHEQTGWLPLRFGQKTQHCQVGGEWAAGLPPLWIPCVLYLSPWWCHLSGRPILNPQSPQTPPFLLPPHLISTQFCNFLHTFLLLWLSLYPCASHGSMHLTWRIWYLPPTALSTFQFSALQFHVHITIGVILPSHSTGQKSFFLEVLQLPHPCQGPLTRPLNLSKAASTWFPAWVVSWFSWAPSTLSSVHHCENTPQAFPSSILCT